MTKTELLYELRRLACPDEHACLGCGREHNCQIHGCVIIKDAIGQIEKCEWISVEDMMPRQFQQVLVIRVNKRGERSIDIGIKEEKDDWRVYGLKTKSVTHWMELPEFPEG